MNNKTNNNNTGVLTMENIAKVNAIQAVGRLSRKYNNGAVDEIQVEAINAVCELTSLVDKLADYTKEQDDRIRDLESALYAAEKTIKEMSKSEMGILDRANHKCKDDCLFTMGENATGADWDGDSVKFPYSDMRKQVMMSNYFDRWNEKNDPRINLNNKDKINEVSLMSLLPDAVQQVILSNGEAIDLPKKDENYDGPQLRKVKDSYKKEDGGITVSCSFCYNDGLSICVCHTRRSEF